MSDKLLSTELIAAEMKRYFERQLAWFNSPGMKAERERWEREWKAKPWWERAWIRTKSKIRQGRIRLGEIVAGQSFDD